MIRSTKGTFGNEKVKMPVVYTACPYCKCGATITLTERRLTELLELGSLEHFCLKCDNLYYIDTKDE